MTPDRRRRTRRTRRQLRRWWRWRGHSLTRNLAGLLGRGSRSQEPDQKPDQKTSPERLPRSVFSPVVRGGFLYVYVRIRGGGESWELLLEPVKAIELPPGRYRVEYRVEKSDPWSGAGQLRLQAGLSYEAKMSQTGVSLREG